MAEIERAIAYAATAHSGQLDRTGAPYILHPLRVMLRMSAELDMMAAALHDVVEDCPVSLDDLRAEGFPEEVVETVDALTRRIGEPYEDYVRRAGATPMSRRIKLADLADNIERSGKLPPSPENLARLERYRAAVSVLSRSSGSLHDA